MKVIGLMSGTSLDGLDICFAEFSEKNGDWDYTIICAETIPYSSERRKKLLSAEKCVGAELMELHREYGNFLGEQVTIFLKKNREEKPALVASHGHTIYHRPAAGYTFQLGDGEAIRNACGISVVNDFRSGDVALGGQGAPLVPMGDKLLFGEYQYCLNLGGFANISYDAQPSPLQMEWDPWERIAFDICPVNYILNFLSLRIGEPFDEDGKISLSGKIIPGLLEKLNSLPFYHQSPPKSLGREWVEKNIIPLLSGKEKTEDLLRTFTEHAAEQISLSCKIGGKMLVTGGGAHNRFLVDLLKEKCEPHITIPNHKTVDFKEALIFAFLGLLRWENEINILKSVTGAERDSSGGTIYR